MFFDLSIPLKFNGPQPNAYGVETALAKPLGDTRTGSSVNFDQYTFTPHCNGTHTECVGHIVNERISVRDCLKDAIVPALLLSVVPAALSEPSALAGGQFAGDRVISAESLIPSTLALRALVTGSQSKALLIRTLPNNDDKLAAVYNEGNIPPYFTAEAIRLIVDSGFTHLLCDLPSIDRIYDNGKLINHRIFWSVEDESFETGPGTRMDSTITELIYVPNEIPDGEYTLNLQIAPFDADCAPSRPLLLIE